MGNCLSCLLGTSNDDDYNETSSLLRHQQQHNQQYLSDYLQEEQILKQQQRQQELVSIVNELNDNLIDVTSFLSGNNNNNASLGNSGILANESNINEEEEIQVSSTKKSLPYVYTKEDKDEILKKLNDIDDEVKQSFKIKSSEPLYIKF
ncbi:conserved hypothetical protein [Candida dubliniensis CD36]|uniref:Uncharacterized protein n=1 Tax=Candida dubliniensis (strain CD36 / ATCC MYA-646 / CBS 7987 / NCPF 3949 / NRRL Y-17841) TaxID=573826 RepID=B9WAE1_CANDC|nr:conserved hypothetical protein [Candida dubliniensis CD36]CAX43360.1 conserved hypothetical protein [Candida dubliniensis CD36]